MSEKKKLYSYHTFMFPFSFNYAKHKKELIKEIVTELKESEWAYSKFNISKNNDGIPNYNEYIYFYKPVQKLLYNLKEENELNNETSAYFNQKEFDFDKENTYEIKVKNREKPYILKIVGISLRMFETGVGILALNLENYDYKDIKDIKSINEYGRRIYPQYVSQCKDCGIGNTLKDVKGSFLPESIKITLAGKEYKEEFKNKDYGNLNGLKISNVIEKLLGNRFEIINENNKKSSKILYEPILDDRMFTICWYGNDLLSNTVKERNNNEYSYLTNSRWAELLFIDGDYNSCQSKSMLSKLLEKHSYDRWIEYSTLYGITRYSFMCISNIEVLDYIVNHMRTMYYQLITICLMQRATILNFKNRITNIVSDGKVEYSEIKGIQKDYLKFINSMCFREITAQEQGIELYNMVKDIMGIDEALKELDNEINELNSFYNLEEENKMNKKLNVLTIMGALFIIPSFITGFFGMNIFSDIFNTFDINYFIDLIWWDVNEIWLWFALFFSTPTFIILSIWVIWQITEKKKFLWRSLFLLIPFIQIVITFFKLKGE